MRAWGAPIRERDDQATSGQAARCRIWSPHAQWEPRSARERQRRPPDHGRHHRGRHGSPGTARDGHRRGRSDAAAPRRRAAPRARRPADRRHGHGRRAGLHRPAQPRRPDDPRRAAARAQSPPGRHDRDRRRRWQRLRALRVARGPARLRRARLGARRPAGHRLRLANRRRLPGPLRRHGQRQCRNARRQLAAPDRGARLGRCPGRRQGPRPDARRPARRDGRGRRRPLLRPRLPAGQLRHDRGARRAHAEPRARPAASITPMFATRSATATSTRSRKPSRSAAAPVPPATSRTSITARPTRAAPRPSSRSSTMRAPRAST